MLVAGLGSGQGRRDEPIAPVKKAPAPSADEQAKASEPAKAIVELPTAELPKSVVEQSTPKAKSAKPADLSLAEAIGIAEKLGKAKAVKAERTDRPTVSFTIDLVNWEGNKSTLVLNGEGRVRELTKGGTMSSGNKKKRIGQ